MASDIVDRLRERADHMELCSPEQMELADAVADIERLREENTRLERERDEAQDQVAELAEMILGENGADSDLATIEAGLIKVFADMEQAEAERDQLRALLKDSTLFLRTAEGALEQYQGTPWMDGLQQLIVLNEAALAEGGRDGE